MSMHAPKPDPDQDRLLDHNYDGIQEYDNPMPRWWVGLFWATIVFSVVYFFNLFGLGTGKGRIASYEAEMAAARAKYGTGGSQLPPMTDEQVLALSRDPAKVAAGKALFETQCVACHRADGGGNIGPNLTDDYWIHGGRPSEILHTVQTGVLDKGMPAWGQMLKPEQVTSAVAYVLTLHGSHPSNPKPPQGTPLGDVARGATGTPASSTPNAPH